MVRLSKSAWAGDVRLKSGMYHVKHVVDGTRHVIVFKSVALPAGKEFSMWEGKEVARLECRVEPAKESAKHQGSSRQERCRPVGNSGDPDCW